MILLVAILSLIAQPVNSHKVLLINDVHLNINSTDYYSQPGEETNIRTLNTVLTEAAKVEDASGTPIEAILLVGDLVKHKMAARDLAIPVEDTQWEQMQLTMIEVITTIKTAFPSVPILPVIGNNDVIYHD